MEDDEAAGAGLLARSLEELSRTIALNAGVTIPIQCPDPDGDRQCATFDVLTRSWVNPWTSGIIDALSVQQRVIELSASFASTILRTDTLVHKFEPEISIRP